MRRQSRHQSQVYSKWSQQFAATILVTGALQIPISAQAQVQNDSVLLTNQASYTYTNTGVDYTFQGTTNQLQVIPHGLIDPLGQILGCNGEILPDYTGFSVALYEPDSKDPTGTELGGLVSLTPTELPDIPNNGIPAGKAPNITNINPFSLTNASQGTYNFLFTAIFR